MSAYSRVIAKSDLSNQDFESPIDQTGYGRVISTPEGQMAANAQPRQQEEGMMKSGLRTVLQIPKGLAASATPVTQTLLNVSAGSAKRETLNELEDLKDRGLITPEKYQESIKKVEKQQPETFSPTLENLSKLIEHVTGLPMEAKTKFQKDLNLLANAYGFSDPTKSIATRLLTAGTAPALSEAQQAMGVPESVAENISLLGPNVAKGAVEKVGRPQKPSGLTTRGYESLEKPRSVTPGKLAHVHEKVENEFKEISNEIFKGNQTATEMSEDFPGFQKKLTEGFKKVENLAKNIPGRISGGKLATKILQTSSRRNRKGIIPSEYEKKHGELITQKMQDIPYNEEYDTSKLLDQYRKGNTELGEYLVPGESTAANKAKRDALLDVNDAIESVFEDMHPKSEFTELFKKTNKANHDKFNIIDINDFIKDVSDGKIDYKLAKKYFDDPSAVGISWKIKNTFGNDAQEDFSQLLTDLISTEKGMANLKPTTKEISELKDVIDLASPRSWWKWIKNTRNTLLDKPAIMVEWSQGIKDLKHNHIEKGINELKKVKEKLIASSFEEPKK
jgi:hypothetical protein